MASLLQPMQTNPEVALRKRIQILEERLEALERNTSKVYPLGSAPASDAGKNGSVVTDTGTSRLWVKMGSVWKYVTLT